MKRYPCQYKPRQCKHCGKTFQPLTSRQYACSPECRFLSITSIFNDSSVCWEWPNGVFPGQGYGQFAWESNKPIGAHRVAYMLAFGAIPEGMFVCHKCDNRKCVNPEHLFLGSCADNVHDMVSKGRHKMGKRKIPKGDEHHSRRTPEKMNRVLSVEQIKEILSSTGSHRDIAKKFGDVSHSTIGRIKRGENALAKKLGLF